MVVPEAEQMSSQGEAESSPPQRTKHTAGNNPNGPLWRQTSIYSLTLDEFQHTLSEGGKNFGSMNMDEFLASIWTAEENQNQQHNFGQNHSSNNSATSSYVNNVDHDHQQIATSDLYTAKGDVPAAGPLRQPSLSRQGSLTLPAPLCRKTVEEVWSEIHGKGGGTNPPDHMSNPRRGAAAAGGGRGNAGNAEAAPRQPTFGEMTLEDFLVKAGVVREQAAAAAAPQPHGVYQNNGMAAGTSFVGNSYGTRNGVYAAAPVAAVPGLQPVRMSNGGGGYGAGPVSPPSSDGGQYGMEIGAMRGRKRIIDGPVEKVVERRQRRMIKNRESAARSRARKQAYTVELEAELNQLREENAHLKQALVELERKQKQQHFEEMKMKVQTKAYRAKEKLRAFRRNVSCPL